MTTTREVPAPPETDKTAPTTDKKVEPVDYELSKDTGVVLLTVELSTESKKSDQGYDILKLLAKKGTKDKDKNVLAEAQMEIALSSGEPGDPESEAIPVERRAAALDLSMALYQAELNSLQDKNLSPEQVTRKVEVEKKLQILTQKRTEGEMAEIENNAVDLAMRSLGTHDFLRAKYKKLGYSEEEIEKRVAKDLKTKQVESLSDYMRAAVQDPDTRVMLLNRYRQTIIRQALNDCKVKDNPSEDERKAAYDLAEKKATKLNSFLMQEDIKDKSKDIGLIALIAAVAVLWQMGTEAYDKELKNTK